MAMPENGHASNGMNKANGRNELKTKPRNPFRWLFGVVVRYVYAPRRWSKIRISYEKLRLTVLLALKQTIHLVCVAYTVLPLPVSVVGFE